MQIFESVTKTFALVNEKFNEATGLMDAEGTAKVKVVADPAAQTIRISGGGGTALIYTGEAEGTANMILMAEDFNRQNGKYDDQ